jgi:serine/threonine-protein kinase
MTSPAATFDEHPLQIGRIIAHKYRVESILGAGGMGVVAVATHLQLREPVAIKFLHPGRVLNSEAVVRFLREAQAARKMRSQHVVRVFDVGQLGDGAPYIVMEHLSGSDLAKLVAEKGPLAVATCVEYVLQACEALAEAHALGIIHRDLKPANLFLTQDVDGSPCVKVLDFGVSKIAAPGYGEESAGGAFSASTDGWAGTTVDSGDAACAAPAERPLEPSPLAQSMASASAANAVTRTRAQLGSPRYMSPEQIQSARDVDARTDVWALGVILYELLAGVPAFDATDMLALHRTILADAPQPLRQRRSDVPRRLEQVIATCMAKAAADRYADVVRVASALAPFAPDGEARCQRIAAIADRASRTAADPELAAPASRARSARLFWPRAAWALAIAAVACGLTVAALRAHRPAPIDERPAVPLSVGAPGPSAPPSVGAPSPSAPPPTSAAPALVAPIASMDPTRRPGPKRPIPKPPVASSSAAPPPAHPSPGVDDLDAGTLFDDPH